MKKIMLLIALFAPLTAGASPGDLDTSFGGGVIVPGESSFDPTPFLMVQPDGKILIEYSQADGFNSKWTLMRLHPEGTPDEGFGVGGVVTTSPKDSSPSFFMPVIDVALQADGKILEAGESLVVRHDSDGSLDTSFNGDGLVVPPSQVFVRALAVQEDGKIVLGGTAACPSCVSDLALARLDAGGSLDSGFNGSGVVTADIGLGWDDKVTKVVAKNGRIFALVQSQLSTLSGPAQFVNSLVVYKDDGTLDTTFDGDGIYATSMDPNNDHKLSTTSLTVQSDGKILLVRFNSNEFGDTSHGTTLIRLNQDGTADTGFGDNGELVLAGGNYYCGGTIVLDADEKILMSCSAVGVVDTRILRINNNGTVDTAFGSNGFSQAISITSNAIPNITSIALQADRKILVAGNSLGTSFVARYETSAALSGTTGGTTMGGTSGGSSGGCSLIR